MSKTQLCQRVDFNIILIDVCNTLKATASHKIQALCACRELDILCKLTYSSMCIEKSMPIYCSTKLLYPL